MAADRFQHAWEIARRLLPALDALFDDATQATPEERRKAQSRRFNAAVRRYEAESREHAKEDRHGRHLPYIGRDGRLSARALAREANVDCAQITRLLKGERAITFATAERLALALSEGFDLFDMSEDMAASWLCEGNAHWPRWDDFRWAPNPGREAVIADLRHVAQLSASRLPAPLASRLRLGLPHPDVEWSEIEALSSREWTPKGSATWYDKLRQPLSEPIAKPWPSGMPVVTWWDAVRLSSDG